MPGLDPGIHAVSPQQLKMPTEWIAWSSRAMTNVKGTQKQTELRTSIYARPATVFE